MALLAIAAAAATTTSSKPKTEASKQTTPTTVAASSTTSTKSSRQSKQLKPVPGENRDKRTLYDFGNAAYLYPQVASRRAGYVDNYYPNTGYYNGQQAIAQYPGSYAGNAYSSYPQYLEAPEPIIEIIIKDANETLAEQPAAPIVTKKKKKKEKVHVFYVNYKKDQNNKLHLESPIASLNNDDNNDEEEEEEEEIVQYPVTPLPPLKSTTLRTIIHPDSEKFHSNSGIHVSFGAESKQQSGHILEEHDAESVQRQVLALPPPTRADYARENNYARASSNLLYNSNSYQQQQQQQHAFAAQQQQLPQQHSSNYFRPPVQQHKQSAAAALNYFDIQPSKETELLKSIPKFEQHITETVHHSAPQQQQQQQQYAYSSTRNEVIHDIPAPNLAPSQAPITGHYITASSTQQQQQQHAQQQPPVYAESTHGQKVMVVTPVPPSAAYAQYQQQQHETVLQVHPSSGLQAQASNNFAQQPRQNAAVDNSPFSVSTYHSDVFKELQQRQQQERQQSNFVTPTAASTTPSTAAPTPTAAAAVNGKASQTLLQLPDEVPEDLRQQLFSSGILNNADISVLDYDKQGDIALENLPAEHLQHFYGAGGGAQIAETNKVLTVVKPNGDKVALSEKQIERVKQSNSLPQKQQLDVKVVRYDETQQQSISDKYVRSDATVVTPVELAERQQYNRYLPLKINGAQFPIPDSEELLGKKIVSVVVLAPVEAQPNEARSSVDSKEVKFLGGELVKTLLKKPTKDNFRRWLEKEARTDIEQQSVVLLVANSSASPAEQEIFMYDIATRNVSKLNGELSSTFVNVAEENASSEDLEHAATVDPSSLGSMMHQQQHRR
ncbi:CG12964 [Drosophila busckii]|uniref:CG12964 n=1 Tax=Drosophila busckii TaxID=30019 RepID=A0A0M4EE53_DROBS|nr:CG12964 [Drosophila busckii]